MKLRSLPPTFGGAVVIATVLAIGVVGSPQSVRATPLTFEDIINNNDVTFNQALGINNAGTIAGYFGSGMAGHPNKGYTVVPSYGQANFTNENFPGSVQTQVTGINNIGTTVGFWSNSNLGVGLDSNFGFVEIGSTFTNVNNPNTATVAPVFNQLLGVNNSNIAVGFYTDAAGVTHGYTYSIGSGTFSADINDPNAVISTTAAAINNLGEIAGFYTDSGGFTEGFIYNGSTFTTLDAPGAVDTSLLGINDLGEIVGFDVDASNNMHGIICSAITLTCTQEDDPNGVGTTTFNGVNDLGQIVGFYVNGAGNTIGLLADPVSVPEPDTLAMFAPLLLGLGFLFGRMRKASLRRVRSHDCSEAYLA
jgi:hypothetical protein